MVTDFRPNDEDYLLPNNECGSINSPETIHYHIMDCDKSGKYLTVWSQTETHLELAKVVAVTPYCGTAVECVTGCETYNWTFTREDVPGSLPFTTSYSNNCEGQSEALNFFFYLSGT